MGAGIGIADAHAHKRQGRPLLCHRAHLDSSSFRGIPFREHLALDASAQQCSLQLKLGAVHERRVGRVRREAEEGISRQYGDQRHGAVLLPQLRGRVRNLGDVIVLARCPNMYVSVMSKIELRRRERELAQSSACTM